MYYPVYLKGGNLNYSGLADAELGIFETTLWVFRNKDELAGQTHLKLTKVNGQKPYFVLLKQK